MSEFKSKNDIKEKETNRENRRQCFLLYDRSNDF